MKFKAHLITEVIIFIILYFWLGLTSSLIITLFHFIPTIGYVMKLKNIAPKLGGLFHSLWIIIISSGIVFYFMGSFIGILATVNLVLHIIMDLCYKGVTIFYPFNKHRFRLGGKRK